MKITWPMPAAPASFCALLLLIFSTAAMAAQSFTPFVSIDPVQRPDPSATPMDGIRWQPVSYGEYRYFHDTDYGGIILPTSVRTMPGLTSWVFNLAS